MYRNVKYKILEGIHKDIENSSRRTTAPLWAAADTVVG